MRRIVAGVGGSAGSAETVRWATGVLGSRCEVLLVHVLPAEQAGDRGATERARAALARLAGMLRVRSVETEVRVGSVAPELAAAAQRFGASLVAVGQPAERGAVESLREDPVAELFHSSPVPVLVGRGASAGPVRRIAAAVDESELRGGVLACTRGMRSMTGAEVAVAYVLEGVPYTRMREAAWSSLRGCDPMEEFTRDVQNALRHNGLPWQGRTVEVREGVRAERYLEAARRTGADLLVLGSHGPGRLRRLFAGSTAVEVSRRAPCPVLVVSEHQWPAIQPLRGETRITAAGTPRLVRGARFRSPPPERASTGE